MAKANKHLDHLEDRIILEGSQGGKDAIDVLKKMGDMLSGKDGPGVAVTTKRPRDYRVNTTRFISSSDFGGCSVKICHSITNANAR